MANGRQGRNDEDRYSGQFAPGFSRIHEDSDLLWVVPFRVRYILGIAGYRFTGKSSALNHLAERHGFRLYTLSMTLRQLADELGQSKSPRKELQDLGDRLRREHQDQRLLARLTLRRIRADHLSHQSTTGRSPRIAVGGFKHPEEVKVFSRIPEFRLMALAIPNTDERYARGRDSGAMHAEVTEAGGDPSQNLFEQFKPLDERDLRGEEGGDDFGQAVEEVVRAVPEPDRIDNAAYGTEELRRKLDDKVRQLDLQYRLPRGH